MDRTNAERQARWRQRQKDLIEAAKRHADAGGAAPTILERELARLQSENTELRQRTAVLEMAVTALRRELAAVQAAKPKRAAQPATPSEEVAALQQRLKAAQTRIRNLTAEKTVAWKRVEQTVNAKPAVITKRDHNILRRVFHPDL